MKKKCTSFSTKIEGKRATSCAACSFWMAKPMLLNTRWRDGEN